MTRTDATLLEFLSSMEPADWGRIALPVTVIYVNLSEKNKVDKSRRTLADRLYKMENNGFVSTLDSQDKPYFYITDHGMEFVTDDSDPE